MDDLSNLTQILARRIRDARRSSNLTQPELAGKLGISTRTLQDWEGAKAFPRPGHRRTLDSWLETVEAAAA